MSQEPDTTISALFGKKKLKNGRNEMIAVVKLGRLANGFEKDHGRVVHLMDKEPSAVGNFRYGVTLCGTTTGRRSAGFVEVELYTRPLCPKCLRKNNKEASC